MLKLTGTQTQYEQPSIKSDTVNVTPTTRHGKLIINRNTGQQFPNHSLFTQTVTTAECFKMTVLLHDEPLHKIKFITK
jgi:hypothetical protein